MAYEHPHAKDFPVGARAVVVSTGPAAMSIVAANLTVTKVTDTQITVESPDGSKIRFRKSDLEQVGTGSTEYGRWHRTLELRGSDAHREAIAFQRRRAAVSRVEQVAERLTTARRAHGVGDTAELRKLITDVRDAAEASLALLDSIDLLDAGE